MGPSIFGVRVGVLWSSWLPVGLDPIELVFKNDVVAPDLLSFDLALVDKLSNPDRRDSELLCDLFCVQ